MPSQPLFLLLLPLAILSLLFAALLRQPQVICLSLNGRMSERPGSLARRRSPTAIDRSAIGLTDNDIRHNHEIHLRGFVSARVLSLCVLGPRALDVWPLQVQLSVRLRAGSVVRPARTFAVLFVVVPHARFF